MKSTFQKLAFFGFSVLACSAAGSAYAGSTSSSGGANPSSKFCIKKGGSLIDLSTPEGNFGLCAFGTAKIDAWALYYARHSSNAPLPEAVAAYMQSSPGPVPCGDARNGGSGCANPSAVKCVNVGGAYGTFAIITANPSGDQEWVSLCSFSDQSSIDAWTLLAGPGAPENSGLDRALKISPPRPQ